MMENGSFHTSDQELSIPSTTPKRPDDSLNYIALPNELPKGLDFSELPPSTLKSATVESLISQNEDLMARLSVTIRRYSQLEERLALAERESKSHQNRMDAVQEQYLILQEKDRVSISRAMELQEENHELGSKLKKIEGIYTELYVQAQALQRRLVTLERYRSRVKRASRPMREKARLYPIVQLELETLKRERSEREMRLINSYEARLSEVRSELQTLKGKAAERDQVYRQKVAIENELVFERRQNEIRTGDLTADVARLQSENSAIRLELKEKIVELETDRRELGIYRRELPELKAENAGLQEQVESLQALWGHKQKETEQAEEKIRGLQKLNQSLSQTLNQQRKEIQTLQSALEIERFESREKIKVLELEIEQFRSQFMPEAR